MNLKGQPVQLTEIAAVTNAIFLAEDQHVECSKCQPQPVEWLRELDATSRALRSLKARLQAEQGHQPVGEWFFSPGKSQRKNAPG